jgi:hypothetical protein
MPVKVAVTITTASRNADLFHLLICFGIQTAGGRPAATGTQGGHGPSSCTTLDTPPTLAGLRGAAGASQTIFLGTPGPRR